MVVTLKIRRIDKELPLPQYAYPGDAGLDLLASEGYEIEPGERALIPTGIALAIPEGYAGFVQPRSGLALAQGLTIVNTPGLIDSHYRGEIKIIALNTDTASSITIERGQRIAQLVILPVPLVEVLECDTLDKTERNAAGFGSSGV
ncbi:MAG: dUTP diphosphatase [Coriobacteriia bacterium]|nr:dUTP diphosphatase [Coriobacteriia bacterium]MCL2749615.1 dUTP diphosphatase [Coriobacteriia bacterium]